MFVTVAMIVIVNILEYIDFLAMFIILTKFYKFISKLHLFLPTDGDINIAPLCPSS
jgi:hypothetical protein